MRGGGGDAVCSSNRLAFSRAQTCAHKRLDHVHNLPIQVRAPPFLLHCLEQLVKACDGGRTAHSDETNSDERLRNSVFREEFLRCDAGFAHALAKLIRNGLESDQGICFTTPRNNPVDVQWNITLHVMMLLETFMEYLYAPSTAAQRFDDEIKNWWLQKFLHFFFITFCLGELEGKSSMYWFLHTRRHFQHLTPFRIENPLGLQIFKDVLVECRDNNGPARRMFLDELVDAQADIFR